MRERDIAPHIYPQPTLAKQSWHTPSQITGHMLRTLPPSERMFLHFDKTSHAREEKSEREWGRAWEKEVVVAVVVAVVVD